MIIRGCHEKFKNHFSDSLKKIEKVIDGSRRI